MRSFDTTLMKNENMNTQEVIFLRDLRHSKNITAGKMVKLLEANGTIVSESTLTRIEQGKIKGSKTILLSTEKVFAVKYVTDPSWLKTIQDALKSWYYQRCLFRNDFKPDIYQSRNSVTETKYLNSNVRVNWEILCFCQEYSTYNSNQFHRTVSRLQKDLNLLQSSELKTISYDEETLFYCCSAFWYLKHKMQKEAVLYLQKALSLSVTSSLPNIRSFIILCFLGCTDCWKNPFDGVRQCQKVMSAFMEEGLIIPAIETQLLNLQFLIKCSQFEKAFQISKKLSDYLELMSNPHLKHDAGVILVRTALYAKEYKHSLFWMRNGTLDSHTPERFIYLPWCLYKLGQYDQALKELKHPFPSGLNRSEARFAALLKKFLNNENDFDALSVSLAESCVKDHNDLLISWIQDLRINFNNHQTNFPK